MTTSATEALTTVVVNGRTIKDVAVSGPVSDFTDDELIEVALVAARETRGSLFNIILKRHDAEPDAPASASVSLWTD